MTVNRRGFVVGGACALAAPWARASAPDEMTVKVTTQAQGALPAFGLGFSAEKNVIGAQNWFVPRNTTFLGCCQRLGPGVLRVGGDHVDVNHWDPRGAGGEPSRTSPRDITLFAEFVKAAGYKVIYGVNFATSKPADAAAEAVAAAQALGPNLLAIEIGNEPNIYTNHDMRPKGYNYGAWIKEWMPFVDAVHNAVPSVPISGPGAFGGWDRWTFPFAKDARGKVQMLTAHYYTASGKAPEATLELLFSKMPELFGNLATSVKLAHDNGFPMGFRMVESNSFVGGGLPGVSDKMAAALWALEYILTAGSVGVQGLCFQIGQAEHSNTPVAMDLKGARVSEVRPEFYAMALAAAVGTGTMMKCDVDGKPAAVAAFAVKSRSGKASVVIVNKGETAFKAKIVPGDGSSSADVVRMTAGGLLKSDVRLNGVEIIVDGRGEAKPVTVGAQDGVVAIDVAGASAVWLAMK